MPADLSNAARWNRTAWGLALAATLALVIAVLLPPFLAPGPRLALVRGFHVLCHQLPARSFAVDGIALAACHRCTGIYVGLVLGVLALPLAHRLRPYLPAASRVNTEGMILLMAVAPAALDWGGDLLGLWTNTVTTRVATGLWFGLLAGLLFAGAVTRVPQRRTDVATR